ncbi:oxidoreductase [Mycobacterium gordonae]|uniref:Oxidoreductase n=1 Tax=Mycobacterium gordonae TaxID=1778 RepID=A0A0Q2Q5W8_MYCGO|nr:MULTISPECIES: NAD(P)-dependent oxidoreductase [Mycobacterium]KQH75381.1 oxidoreductase [Mycobacterium gordonae]MDP7729218.1 NAD(P)-dependent oxidoreductase [Mycobacterium sp. TY813]
MSGTVLITGAFGLVGTETVRRFAADGWQVVATAHRKAYDELPPRVQTRWTDLTDPAQVRSVVSEVSPDVIVHLAAVIPPLVYRDAAFARTLNVGATASLVHAASDQPNSPRFLHASSTAIYGSRNPYRHPELITLDTPIRPCELYGGHKLEAEQHVRSSNLDWVVLRLGGVFSVDPRAMPVSLDMAYFGSALPWDGRVHAVDTRDVAVAFATAAHSDVVGQTFLIGGDESHLLRQGEIAPAMAAAQGMKGVVPQGRPGDPNNDDGWYPNADWMDVAEAQRVLKFQHHSWPDMLAEMRAQAGWKRYPRRVIVPLARQVIKRQAAYRKSPGQYADPWSALGARFGSTAVDTARA